MVDVDVDANVDADILQFYAFSADKPAGKGVGDCINNENDYAELNSIKDWRKMFSSFWSQAPFMFEGKTYLSFEHAYQASKFIINGYEEFANKFNLESNDKISLLVGKDVQKAGRIMKLNYSEIGVWDTFNGDIKKRIYRAKFTLNSLPGRALIATKNAQLINNGPRIKRIRCVRLEQLREELNTAQNTT